MKAGKAITQAMQQQRATDRLPLAGIRLAMVITPKSWRRGRHWFQLSGTTG